MKDYAKLIIDYCNKNGLECDLAHDIWKPDMYEVTLWIPIDKVCYAYNPSKSSNPLKITKYIDVYDLEKTDNPEETLTHILDDMAECLRNTNCV